MYFPVNISSTVFQSVFNFFFLCRDWSILVKELVVITSTQGMGLAGAMAGSLAGTMVLGPIGTILFGILGKGENWEWRGFFMYQFSLLGRRDFRSLHRVAYYEQDSKRSVKKAEVGTAHKRHVLPAGYLPHSTN